MEAYNNVLTRTYKNAEIEIVVEDNIITTAKVYIDKKCVVSTDIMAEGGTELPFTKANYTAVMDSMKEDVDKMWEANFAAIGR